MSQRTCLFLVLLFVMVCCAGTMLVWDAHIEAAHQGASRDFQLLVGGLGFGPTAKLNECPFAYDPRLGCSCANDFTSLPGAASFSPHQAQADLVPPMNNRRLRDGTGGPE
jgi:hypothetical protein